MCCGGYISCVSIPILLGTYYIVLSRVPSRLNEKKLQMARVFIIVSSRRIELASKGPLEITQLLLS